MEGLVSSPLPLMHPSAAHDPSDYASAGLWRLSGSSLHWVAAQAEQYQSGGAAELSEDLV